MTARVARTSRFVHALAIGVGLIGMLPVSLLAKFLVELLGVRQSDTVFVFASVMFIAYAAAGVAFGSLWPEKSWRWGVWIGLLPFIWASLDSPFMTFMLLGVVVLPACAAAQAAARLRLGRAGASLAGQQQRTFMPPASQTARTTFIRK